MKDKINSYFAVLIITIAGAGATMLIVHVAYANTSALVFGTEAQYLVPQDSTIKNK